MISFRMQSAQPLSKYNVKENYNFPSKVREVTKEGGDQWMEIGI